MTPVLALRQVTKTYPGPLSVLVDIDLTVHTGEYVAIVGPSGSGKSTLLHIMGTLDRASTGQVSVDGYDTTVMSDAEVSALRAYTIGFVFQQFHLTDSMTAVDNVAAGLLYRGIPRPERRRAASETLIRVGLGNRLGNKAAALSGGERQRVAIARAVVGQPAVVLADEPTGNLDSRSGAAILDLLDGLHGEGTTIVLITHDAAVAGTAGRIIELYDGRIVADRHPGRGAAW